MIVKKKGMSKNLLCILLTAAFVGIVVWMAVDYSKKREMFELIHILSNGDILWYGQQGRGSIQFPRQIESNPSFGPVQPYLVRCSEDKNRQLCQYLKGNQSPPQQFQTARAYSDYAYMRGMAPQQPGNAFPPLNTTW